MSRGIISIGGKDFFKIADQEFSSTNKDILIENGNDSSGDTEFRLGGATASFHVTDLDDKPVFSVNDYGNSRFKTIKALPNSGEAVGEKGDLRLRASDQGSNNHCHIRLHYDSTNPQILIEGSNLKSFNNTDITNSSNQTYSVDAILGGYISRNTSGTSRDDVLPSADDIINNLKNPKIGDTIEFMIKNTASLLTNMNHTSKQPWISLQVGSGADIFVGSIGQDTVLPTEMKIYQIVVSGVSPNSYSLYNLVSNNRQNMNFMALYYTNPAGSADISLTNTPVNMFEAIVAAEGSGSITVQPTAATINMFTYGSYFLTNRGPKCMIRIIGRISCAKSDAGIVMAELSILKNSSVIHSTNGEIGAELERDTWSSPQICTTILTDFDYDDELELVFKQITTTSNITIYSIHFLVIQINFSP